MDTIYSLFQKIVKEHYDKTAVIENTRSMTFGELDRDSGRSGPESEYPEAAAQTMMDRF